MSTVPALLKVENARELLAKFVCDASVSPYSCIKEDGAFSNIINYLNPNFQTNFTFESLERNCLKLYGERKKEVKESFLKLSGSISLSVDQLMYEEHWSGDANECICIAAHFIDDDWNLRRWVIMYGPIYDENRVIASDAILKSLKEWDIQQKLFSLSVWNYGDVADYVKEKIQGEKHLPLNGQLFHVKCSSDIISRMVQKGFSMIEDIISKIKELRWSKSFPLWYLTTTKLKNALELEALGEFSAEWISQEYEVPSEEEWGKVRSICRIADKIYNIVEPLFELKRPTANIFLPHLLEIRDYLNQESSSSDEFVKTVSQKMLKCFNKFWKDMYVTLAIAAFLDPRYKMKFIEFSFSGQQADNSDSQAAMILETIRKLHNEYMINSHEKEYLLSESSESDDEEEFDRTSKKQCCKLEDRLNILSKFRWSMQSAKDQPHKSDLDLYLEEPILPWTQNFSVLLWWKDYSSKYPNLSRMARDVLAIPMSLASSYEAYYTVPREGDRTLVSLKPKFMNALACTRSWTHHHKKNHQDTKND